MLDIGYWILDIQLYKTKNPEQVKLTQGSIKSIRRHPTRTHCCPCSTIGATLLTNFKSDRVRDGNGCDLGAMVTFYNIQQHQNIVFLISDSTKQKTLSK